MRLANVMIVLGLCSGLAACQTTGTNRVDPFANTSQPLPEVPQFKDGKSTAGTTKVAAPAPVEKKQAPIQSLVRVVRADVDVSVASGRQVRGFTFSDEQAEAILAKGIMGAMAPLRAGSTPVRLAVRVDRLYIPNPAWGAFSGSNYPSVSAIVQMVDNRTGQPIGDAFKVTTGGMKATGGEFRPGTLGALLQKGEAKEFENLANALGAELQKAILQPKR